MATNQEIIEMRNKILYEVEDMGIEVSTLYYGGVIKMPNLEIEFDFNFRPFGISVYVFNPISFNYNKFKTFKAETLEEVRTIILNMVEGYTNDRKIRRLQEIEKQAKFTTKTLYKRLKEIKNNYLTKKDILEELNKAIFYTKDLNEKLKIEEEEY